MGAGILFIVMGLILLFGDSADRRIWTMFGIGFAWTGLYVYFNQRRLKSVLKLVDATYGTQFYGDHQVGFHQEGDMVLFDSKMKKILFLKYYSRCVWIFNYSDIESWRMSWDEKSGATRILESNFAFLFEIKDIETPTIKMCVSMSRAAAESWKQRIGLILSGEKLPEASRR